MKNERERERERERKEWGDVQPRGLYYVRERGVPTHGMYLPTLPKVGNSQVTFTFKNINLFLLFFQLYFHETTLSQIVGTK